MKTRSLLCVLLLVLLSLTAVGCSDPKIEEAKPFVTDFFAAVKAVGEADDDTTIEEYADALTYFHPDYKNAPLNTFFNNSYTYGGMNFAAENAAITSFTESSSVYDAELGGQAYTLIFRMTIGEIEANVRVVILENEKGYGICDINAIPIENWG